MKRFNVLIFSLYFSLVIPAFAQGDPGSASSAGNKKWLRISEIEQEQAKIFDQYRTDKDELKQKYEEALEALEQTGGEDMMAGKIRLEKEFKRKKERLLESYRQDNWRLQKESNSLKGRKTVVTSDYQMKNRLKKASNIDSDMGKKK
ncbi:MAG: hypothetical protein AB7S78_06555 [Candidatus Omnitrophota bacterium]